jgi:hypothetical protein
MQHSNQTSLCPVSDAPASVDWEQEINLNYNN